MNTIRNCLIITLIWLIFSACTVSAYIITIDAPKTVVKGTPLVVSGTTTFPEDAYFDLVLYYSKYTAGEVARQRVIVDPVQEFRINFESRELEKGQYKVEVHNIYSNNELFVERQLGSSSIIRRIIQVTDRSDEISISSPETQELKAALTIAGRVKKLGDGVITLRIYGPDNYSYGPVQLVTTKGYADSDGHFSTTVPIFSPGDYYVSISDKSGFIGEYQFLVTDDSTTALEEEIVEEEILQEPVVEKKPELEMPSPTKSGPVPTTTESPVSLISIIAAISLTGGIVADRIRKRRD